MPVKPTESTRLRELGPDPTRFWVRYSPRVWPGPTGFWTHLGLAELGESVPGATAEIERPVDDLLYLPPVESGAHAARLATARARLAEGAPVLLQLFPGESCSLAEAAVVFDLLPTLVSGTLVPLDSLPEGAVVVWPLVAGLTDDSELWRRGCERLARAGAEVVQPLILALSPESRRRLAEGRSDEVFRALFHGQAPQERAFSRLARSFGLTTRWRRPIPRRPLLGAGNRRLAGELMLAAELWLALDRPVGQGLALWRAARWVDASNHEVAALCREGNLGVIPELDTMSRELLVESVESGRLSLVEQLLAEYEGTAPGA